MTSNSLMPRLKVFQGIQEVGVQSILIVSFPGLNHEVTTQLVRYTLCEAVGLLTSKGHTNQREMCMFSLKKQLRLWLYFKVNTEKENFIFFLFLILKHIIPGA